MTTFEKKLIEVVREAAEEELKNPDTLCGSKAEAERSCAESFGEFLLEWAGVDEDE